MVSAGISAAALLAMLTAATPSFAQDEVRDTAQAPMTGTTSRASIASDVAALEGEREKLNASLVETAALIQSSEAQMSAIESRIIEQEAREKVLRTNLAASKGDVAKLLAALQRMGRNPPPVMITKREDALQMVRSAMLLASAFPELKDKALSLASKLDDLQKLIAGTKAEYQRLKDETDRLNEMRTRLSGLLDTKRATITERQTELVAIREATADVSKTSKNLGELITKLDETITEKTGLGAYDRELKATAVRTAEPAAATAATTAAATTTTTSAEQKVALAAPPPSSEPTIVELAPTSKTRITGSAARMKPALPFAEARGKLALPAHGKRVIDFGGRTQFGGQSKGLVIETRHGAQITSPCDGWIVWAGEFRSYGQLLIINAGDGYHVLLAGLSEIDVEQGQFVLASEPVGTMSGGGRNSMAAIDAGAPILYVEFRKDGAPINPDPWWVTGQQKVQG